MIEKNQFTLSGFTHQDGFRVFAFEREGEGRTRTKYSVRAELALAVKYGIHLQELPLLCRTLLDQRSASVAIPPLTFTEEQIRACAAARALAASKRSPSSRPRADNTGTAWCAQQS
jgi:hypothetical protein